MTPPNKAPTIPRLATSWPVEVEAADGGSGAEAASGVARGRCADAVNLPMPVVHEVARSDGRRELSAGDVAGDLGYLALEFGAKTRGETLLERVVVVSAALPLGVCPVGEGLVPGHGDDLDGGVAGMTELEAGIWRTGTRSRRLGRAR